jgi:hypothetical protein
MPWLYEQKTGQMFNPSGALSGIGYSGAPEGKNNPLMQAAHDIGPIPVGWYTMQGPVDSHVHGRYAIPLEPDQLNEMFGRTGFMCHGDSVTNPGSASEGCIIQPYSTRVAMWESGDHRLQVLEERETLV